ncbi:hypothetical protein EKK58_07180 [Candidatus Dependentiae bacterium]|nr:MAG: hypothetical protein EKK58_07180 [Candidatus Dependentiae bacterium]
MSFYSIKIQKINISKPLYYVLSFLILLSIQHDVQATSFIYNNTSQTMTAYCAYASHDKTSAYQYKRECMQKATIHFKEKLEYEEKSSECIVIKLTVFEENGAKAIISLPLQPSLKKPSIQNAGICTW